MCPLQRARRLLPLSRGCAPGRWLGSCRRVRAQGEHARGAGLVRADAAAEDGAGQLGRQAGDGVEAGGRGEGGDAQQHRAAAGARAEARGAR
eukprot:554621-Prymnesium_polylepis.1